MLLDIVSMCLVVLFSDFWDQYQSEDSVSVCSGRPRGYTTPTKTALPSSFGTGKEHYCATARLRTTFKHQEEESPRHGAKSSSNAGLYARDQLCAFPQRTTAKEPLMLGKKRA
ncbi:hypothetical protein TNCV_2340731 [Trichonephila clavipes]|nr:hypothetical protein TNCV_2340731 [Trichonephila clavipes]